MGEEIGKIIRTFKKKKKTYWIHAASHGEALMALPIIEKILNEKNNQVTMSFFSASGFENFNYKSSRSLNFIYQLIKKIIIKINRILNPKLLIFIKYDLWLNLISDCQNRGIPTVLVSAKFRKKQWYFTHSGKKLNLF